MQTEETPRSIPPRPARTTHRGTGGDRGGRAVRAALAALAAMAVTAAATATATVATVAGSAATAAADAAPGSTASAYRAVGPLRVLDTRLHGGIAPGPRTSLAVPLRDLPGVPHGAVAAAVTIVAADSTGPGYVAAWGGGDRPATSALNLDAAGQTRANFAIVPIGPDGSMHLYTHGGGHLVADLTGVFVPAAASTSGRFVGLGPTRLLDTRTTHAPLAAGEVRSIDIEPSGVPRSAGSAVVSFTAVGPAGWFAAWQPDRQWPGTSVVNVSVAGSPATATAIVPITGGRMNVSSLNGGDVVIDVAGYMTGDADEETTTGLFVPIAPTRVYDSRTTSASGAPLGGGTTITRRLLAADDAGALAMSVTAVDAAPGFVTMYPGRAARPNTANVNVGAGQTLATGAITSSSTAGTSVFTLGRLHLVIDVTGYFVATPAEDLGSPVAPPTPPVVTPQSGSYRLAMVGADGSIARWDPCESIEVHVDFTGSQPGAREALAQALEQATRASGLQFLVTETTSRARTNGLSTLTVLWMSDAEMPAFRDGSVGLGGGAYTAEQIVEAWVYIDRDDPLVVPGTNRSMLVDVLLHELGHALGLAHVDDSAQVMFPYVSEKGGYQPGDLLGLELLGASQGCLTPPPSLRTSTGSRTLADDAPIPAVLSVFEMA